MTKYSKEQDRKWIDKVLKSGRKLTGKDAVRAMHIIAEILK